MRDRDICAVHDPEIRARAQAKGSEANSEVGTKRRQALAIAQAEIRLAAIQDIPATLERIAHQVAAGLIKPMAGGVLAQLARAAVAAHTSIDELAERAQRRRTGASEEQIREALDRIRGNRQAQEPS